MIQSTNTGSDGIPRDGDNLVNHDLGHVLKAIGGRGGDSQSEQRCIQCVGGQETNGYATKGRKEIGLKNEGRARFTTVVTFGSNGYDVTSFYALSQSAISEMKSSVGFS